MIHPSFLNFIYEIKYFYPHIVHLSPIEDVLEDVKRKLYNDNYYSLKELTELFETKFYEKVDNISYYENWVMKFFGVNIS